MLLSGNPPRRNQPKPKPKFKVCWIGEKDPNNTFEKLFFKEDEAVKFADELNGALVLEKAAVKKDATMYEIVPTEMSKEIQKNMAIVRKIKEKYSSANGEKQTVSTQNFEERQKARLFKGFIIAPFLVYTGYAYKLPNPIRIALAVSGLALGLHEVKYFLVNKKLQKAK
jgi:hypothetical protein